MPLHQTVPRCLHSRLSTTPTRRASIGLGRWADDSHDLKNNQVWRAGSRAVIAWNSVAASVDPRRRTVSIPLLLLRQPMAYIWIWTTDSAALRSVSARSGTVRKPLLPSPLRQRRKRLHQCAVMLQDCAGLLFFAAMTCRFSLPPCHCTALLQGHRSRPALYLTVPDSGRRFCG